MDKRKEDFMTKNIETRTIIINGIEYLQYRFTVQERKTDEKNS